MTRRNYNTPGRLAATAATKTQPGAPRARKADPREKPRPVEKQFKPDDVEDEPINGAKITWKTEAELERDPDLPASTVKLKDHPLIMAGKRDALAAQVREWYAAGFLPVAVSRLVGLRPADCLKLNRPNPI